MIFPQEGLEKGSSKALEALCEEGAILLPLKLPRSLRGRERP